MLVHFSKMECLGQDFMVMDAVTEKIFPVPEKISKWARRCTGVGFSEFALVEPPYDPDTDFYFMSVNPVTEDSVHVTDEEILTKMCLEKIDEDTNTIGDPCITVLFD